MFLLFIFFSSSVLVQAQALPEAVDHLFSGETAPREIPWDFLEKSGAVHLEEISEEFGKLLVQIQSPAINKLNPGEANTSDRSKNYVLPPMVKSLRWHGQEELKAVHRQELTEVFFSEESLAYVPTDKAIEVSRDARRREIWSYPVGTYVLHVIRFQNPEKSLFEVRVVFRSNKQKWVYATYVHPSFSRAGFVLGSEAKESLLLLDEGNEVIHGKLSTIAVFPRSPQDYEPSSLEMNRASLGRPAYRSCKGCHFSSSPSAYQYDSVDEAGPCGFVPTNPYVKSSWLKHYLAKYPHALGPFTSQ